MKHIILTLLIFSAACVTSEPMPLPIASSQYKTVQDVNPLVCENMVLVSECTIHACDGTAGNCTVVSHNDWYADTDCDTVLDQAFYPDQGPRDNCTQTCNPDQTNSDTDPFGDACDPCPLDPANDIDKDLICGDTDNCPGHHNPQQLDADSDGFGDECDPS